MVFDGRTAVYLQAHVAQSHFVYFAREFQTSPDIHAFWNDISDSVARQGGLNEIFRKAGEAANGVFNPAPSTTSWVAGARYTLRAPADFPSSPQELVNYSVNVGFRPGFPRSLLDTYSHTLSWNGRTVSFRVPKVPYLFAEHLIALHGRVVRAEKSAARPEDVADTIVLLYAIYGANRWAWPTTLPWRELGEAGSSFAQLTGIGSSLRLFATNPPWVPRVLSSAVGALSTSAEQRSRIQRALDELQPVAQPLSGLGRAWSGSRSCPLPNASAFGVALAFASRFSSPLRFAFRRGSDDPPPSRCATLRHSRSSFSDCRNPTGSLACPSSSSFPDIFSRRRRSSPSAGAHSRPASFPRRFFRHLRLDTLSPSDPTGRQSSQRSPLHASGASAAFPPPLAGRGRHRLHRPFDPRSLAHPGSISSRPLSRPGGANSDALSGRGSSASASPSVCARPAAPAPSRNLPPLRRTPSAAELHSRRAQSPARAFPSSGDNLPDPAPFPSHLYSPSGRPLYATSPSARTASSVPFSATDTALERNGFAPWPGRQRRPSTSGLVPQPRYGGGY
ncbi:hypothetical protein JCM8097_006857 [Rhodosporidiobolus ruineniae]